MDKHFSAEEILDIAVRMEVEGEKFYRLAADIIEEPSTKKLLCDLAKWEDSHRQLFTKMREEISLGSKDYLCDLDGDAMKYLVALVQQDIFEFEHRLPLLKKGCTPIEVLRVAFGFEKDTISYFVGLGELVVSDLAKSQIDIIVREEMAHARMISEHIESLKKEQKGDTMQKYECIVCSYVYDPELGDPDNGVAAGTPWEDVPEDWLCPECGVGKDEFEPVD